MKTRIILLILLFPSLLNAQTEPAYSNRDKVLINARIDTLLTNFMSKSTLTEAGKVKRSDKITAEYKKLFAVDATVFDDVLAKFDPNATGYPYKLQTKSRNEYIDDLIMEFENGLVINNKRINVSYEDFNKGMVRASLEREISGVTKTQKYRFSIHDTVMISVVIFPDKTVKIQSVEALGNPQVKISNDGDLDGVIDELDACVKEKGIISLNGCPDSDKDGIADKDDECPLVSGLKENGGCPASTFAYSFVFSGGIGYQFNNNSIKTPEIDDYAYNSLDKSRSFTGEVSAPGYKGSLSLNGNLGYYFGRKKNNRNKGVSIGLAATNYKATYDISGARFEFKSNDGVNDYRRVVTMLKAKEEMSFSIINIPLLFRYKEKFSPKAGFEIFAGPSFISFITNSNYESSFSFEGIYQVDNNNFIFDPTFDPTSSTHLYLTESGINNHLFIDDQNPAGPNVNALFSQLNAQGYDFDMQKDFSGKDNQIQTHYGIAFNGGADLFYHVTKKMAVKFGAIITVAGLNSGQSDPYVMIDRTKDQYNSIYRSKANSTYTSLNINLGIILGI